MKRASKKYHAHLTFCSVLFSLLEHSTYLGSLNTSLMLAFCHTPLGEGPTWVEEHTADLFCRPRDCFQTERTVDTSSGS